MHMYMDDQERHSRDTTPDGISLVARLNSASIGRALDYIYAATLVPFGGTFAKLYYYYYYYYRRRHRDGWQRCPRIVYAIIIMIF